MTKQERNQQLGIYTEVTQIKDGDSRYVTKGENRYEVVKFDSCNEMIEKLQQGQSTRGWEGNRKGERDQWTYGQLRDNQTTLQYLKEGQVLDTVLAKANKTYEELMSQPVVEEMLMKAETFKRRKVYSEEGAELCIDRVMCADPAHWVKTIRGKKCPLVRLGMNIGGSCGENENVFNNMAAVSGVVADILTRAGFSVELYAVTTSAATTSSNGYSTVMTCLKKAEEALDLKRIYSVGCSGYFRDWVFQVYYNILSGTATSGLGYVCNVTKDMTRVLDIDYVIDNSFIPDNNRSAYIKIQDMFNEILTNKA